MLRLIRIVPVKLKTTVHFSHNGGHAKVKSDVLFSYFSVNHRRVQNVNHYLQTWQRAKCEIRCENILQMRQGCSRRSGWSGFNLTTFRPLRDFFSVAKEFAYFTHGVYVL